MTLTIVDKSKLAKDPRKLPFFYPKMPVIRYRDISEEYHKQLTLHVAEQMARMLDQHVIPSACIHHRRRLSSRRLQIHGRSYYVLSRDELTDLEWAKYEAYCTSGDDQAANQ